MTVATQQERVRAALQANPSRGIAQPDFLGPDTIDGAKPITRLAARIEELRDMGVAIEVVGRRNRCAIYRLVDAEGGSRGTFSSSSRAAPVVPLNAGMAHVCWATQECRAAGPLDGAVCPRGDWHTVRRVHYLDLVPRAVEERIAA